MKYFVDAAGIHYYETGFDADYPADREIPLAEAVEEIHKIRDAQDAALTLCECEQQGATAKCGACE